jgi:hypothetical protein
MLSAQCRTHQTVHRGRRTKAQAGSSLVDAESVGDGGRFAATGDA